jgi:hypothetical protein
MLSHIQELTPSPPYHVDVPLKYLGENIERYLGYGLDLNPDFQRGHVWNAEQKRLWMEFLLRGGKGPDLLFNHPGWQHDFKGDFVIVDGKQRLAACLEFIAGKFKVFPGAQGNPEGWAITEIDPKLLFRPTVSLSVNNLKSRREVLRWYLELNSGYIAHTPEELERVAELIKNEP